MPAQDHLYIIGVDPDRTDRRMARGETTTFQGALDCARELCRQYGIAHAEIRGFLHGERFAVNYTAESWEEVA